MLAVKSYLTKTVKNYLTFTVRKEIINSIYGFGITEIKGLPKVQRDQIILRLKGIDGLSQRQTARILGISPNMVFKV